MEMLISETVDEGVGEMGVEGGNEVLGGSVGELLGLGL